MRLKKQSLETESERNMRVVIVGGVAGGMSAAARLRRRDEGAEIIVLERGNYVSFANCGLPSGAAWCAGMLFVVS